MRKGTTKLLNNFKESVIIAHRKTGQLLFANTAAGRLNTHCVENLCISGDFESLDRRKDDFSIFGCREKQFSKIDLKILHNI